MSDPLAVLAELEQPAWLVGGALRDRLLGRPTTDYDVAIDGDAQRGAKALARGAGGHAFELSEGFGVWRVVSHERAWQVDLLPLGGRSISLDLAKRDLTVNAIAQPLGGGELVDPFGGLSDLHDRRLRMISPDAFTQDPLRVVRVARLACELDFSIDSQTAAVATRSAPLLREVAPERIFTELKRIVCAERALDGLRLMDELAATEIVLPELTQLHGVEQSSYHHLDVYAHTLAVLAETIELERDPRPALGDQAEAVSEFLSTPLANELNRWQALRFGALLHDIAKPQTRRISAEGRVTFMGHDAAGKELASSVMSRLRAGERLSDLVGALARHHLRVGFLVHDMPLPRRAVYRYLRETHPVQVDVTVLSVADRLATRGERSVEAIAKHLDLAQQLLGEALQWLADPPKPPLRGDELARALGITPGPELGRILSVLAEDAFSREISSREEAIERARELLGADR